MNPGTCVNCGYRPCRCPFYAEDDKYEIAYDEMYILDCNQEEED